MSTLYLNLSLQERENNIVDLLNRSLFDDKEIDSNKALEYLKKRKLDLDIIEKFKLGWYPPNRFISGKSPLLVGRIIFPIIDEYGDVRALSGRQIYNDPKSPKYFHESYPKSFFLYGLNLAWKSILETNIAILVEGQMDVVACHKSGITNAVGVMGSKFRFETFSKTNRFCDNYLIMFDQDRAGIEGAKKAKELIESLGKKAIIAKLKTKDGDFDPDSFCFKYGEEGLKKAVNYYLKKENLNE